MDLTNLVRNESIAAQISEGAQTAASALNIVRHAAIEFVSLIPWDYESKDIPAIIKHGRALYKEDFQGDTNLSAWFGDCATLAMAGNASLSFVDDKKEEHQTTAEKALGLSKHKLKAAAKAARDDMEIGRASGGGRTPKTPTSAPVQHVFSLIELKSQLDGLFSHSADPVAVLNKVLADYKCEVTPIAKRVSKRKAA